MSRIRSIHPGFFTDEDLVAVSMAARLLFLGLGVEADDKGIFEWKPLTIKMRIFPADNVEVGNLLDELAAAGAIKSYSHCGRTFGAIRNFRRHQKPKTPNDIHPAPAEILAFVGLENSETGKAKDGAISEKEDDQQTLFPQNGEKPFQMEDGGWRGEEELEPDGSCASGDALLPEHIVETWNRDIAPKLGKPKVRMLTPERRVKLKARIAGFSIDEFREVIGNIERSPFLRGDTGWHGMSFDWFTKKANFLKILEGNYNG